MKSSVSFIRAVLPLFLLAPVSCMGPENKTIEVSVNFVEGEVSVPINGSASAVLEVEPENRLSDVEYSLVDTDVAMVDGVSVDAGRMTFTLINKGNLGSTTLVAILDDKIATCKVVVAPVEVSGISLEPETKEMKVGEETYLTATVTPDNATFPVISWRSSDSDVVSVENGYVKALAAGEADITATCSGFNATCRITVSDVAAESMTLSVQSRECTSIDILENESVIVDAALLPENVTLKKVEWSVSSPDIIAISPFDALESDNIGSVTVTALASGSCTLKAVAGSVQKEIPVTVKAVEIPVADPKVGDYFYSDGTWSDGGLISISADGCTAQWAEEKPAPVEGKTVIGIVFQTDPDRLSQYLKDDGFVHGLVLCTKAAHKPGDSLTMYSSVGVDCIGTHTFGSSWYDDIWGRKWTRTIMQYYPGTELQKCPAFDWTVTDFQPAAPGNTSGWFVPSIGQVWDLLVNLGGPEVGEALRPFRTYDYDITYYKESQDSGYGDIGVGCDVRERINSHMAKVESSQKEELIVSRASSDACEIMSSTIYQKGESECTFWLVGNGKICATASWMDDKIICRPVLAF